MDFEWDAIKERENVRKHNVTFLEAVESFSDPSGFVMIDKKHSKAEERFYWCFASDGNGTFGMTRYLVPEPYRRQVPWQKEDVGDALQLLIR